MASFFFGMTRFRVHGGVLPTTKSWHRVEIHLRAEVLRLKP